VLPARGTSLRSWDDRPEGRPLFACTGRLVFGRLLPAVAILPSRIAQSAYNAQTIVSKKPASAGHKKPVAIGVDIGGTSVKAAIVDMGGELLKTFRASTPRNTGALRDFVHSVLKSGKAPMQGIGIGCKGIIDADSTCVKSSPGDVSF